MLKVKHERECDCVVAGFRWHKNGEGTAVGSLLLGLYDDAGALQHVGVCASFTDGEAQGAGRVPRAVPRERARRSSVEGVGGRWPIEDGATAHAGRTEPLEHGQGSVVGAAAPRARGRGRLRPHAGRRASATRRSSAAGGTDKQPTDCTYAQLEVVPPQELAAIFARRGR